jgi:hypothetical protein
MVYNWPVFRCPSLAGFGCPPREGEAAELFVKQATLEDKIRLVELNSLLRQCPSTDRGAFH